MKKTGTTLKTEKEVHITYLPIETISEYENNPRFNDSAVDKVAKSIQSYGFLVPIVVDKNNIILAGHTRLKASKQLGLKEVPCIVADSLTDLQGKEFRIADNRVGEFAQWDVERLKEEIADIGNSSFEDDFEIQSLIEEPAVQEDDPKYTDRITAPVYVPTSDSEVKESWLVDKTQYNQLNEQIDSADISEEAREFLKLASCRHLRFDYEAIADYYAKADAVVQDLMERSGLVIIDYNKAIEYGYSHLRSIIDEELQKDLNTDD